MKFCDRYNPKMFPDWAYFLHAWKDTLDRLDEITEDNNLRITTVERLAADLKTFVNTYFDNLDVQTEINVKIDSMVADGTFMEAAGALITGTISTWLAQHITQPTTPVVDNSLTIHGAAADAYATGVRIADRAGREWLRFDDQGIKLYNGSTHAYEVISYSRLSEVMSSNAFITMYITTTAYGTLIGYYNGNLADGHTFYATYPNGIIRVYMGSDSVPHIEYRHLWQDIHDNTEAIDMLYADVASKMERYIVRLVKSGDTYSVQKYDTGETISFDELTTAIRNTSNYVVCVYGNSKLRPQYISSSEIVFTGLNRDASGADALRMIVRPSGVQYDALGLASETALNGVDSRLSESMNEISDDVYRNLTPSKNILRPYKYAEGAGIVSQYDKSTNAFVIAGTKKSGDYTRLTIGEFIPIISGTYSSQFFDVSGDGKSAIYVCSGDTIIATIGATSFKSIFVLEAGVKYTFELYVAPKAVVSYKISAMIVMGTDNLPFTPYELLLNVNRIYGINERIEDIVKTVDLTGKKISILGVSIDTYKGWIPNENVAYYSDTTANLPNGVNDTWWKRLIDSTGAILLKNNSWTGACATTNGKTYESSGVKRCIELSDTTENPDIIMIGMFGANDWMYSECGAWDMSKSDLLASIDVDLSVQDNYVHYQSVIETYSGAMATIFYRIQEKYPNARIFALSMYNYSRSNGKNPPRRSMTSKTYTIAQYNKALKDVSDYFGVTVIPCDGCGINAKNSVNYTVEGEGAVSNLHPNAVGHELIYKTVINTLKNIF